jgi:CRISPR-associated protein Cas1
MARRVGSGDPDNMEAQAARRYWPLLFGESFRRDRDEQGINAMLNYGYAVLRAATARAVCGAGLHPAISLSHKSEDMGLIDDLMEPFRPMIDLMVARAIDTGHTGVTKETKRYLASVASVDMQTERGRTPVFTCAERLAQSLAQSCASGKPDLDFPLAPLPLELPTPPEPVA